MHKFIERYKNIIPLEDIQGLITTQPPKTIRINTYLTTKENLSERLKKKGFVISDHPLYENALIIHKEPFSIGATTEYLDGQYIVQDVSSMISVCELDLKEGEVVLDMTAGPGAKTTHICEFLKNSGAVIAVDSNKKRLKSVKYNCERMGFSNVVGLNIEAEKLKEIGIKFDKILLDPPCSAEGTLHKNPEIVNKKIPYKRLIKIQISLIETAIKLLNPGGILIYSTCTINPDENEGVVQHALNQGMKLIDLNTPYGKEGLIKKTKRFYPHLHQTQGFFIAKMVK